MIVGCDRLVFNSTTICTRNQSRQTTTEMTKQGSASWLVLCHIREFGPRQREAPLREMHGCTCRLHMQIAQHNLNVDYSADQPPETKKLSARARSLSPMSSSPNLGIDKNGLLSGVYSTYGCAGCVFGPAY